MAAIQACVGTCLHAGIASSRGKISFRAISTSSGKGSFIADLGEQEVKNIAEPVRVGFLMDLQGTLVELLRFAVLAVMPIDFTKGCEQAREFPDLTSERLQ